MPSRMIREGFITSQRVARLAAPEERFFFRLLLVVDDFGRHEAFPQLLRSALYPLCDDVRSADILRFLAACERAELVRCYEAEGKRYLEVQRFRQRLRAMRSKCPEPPWKHEREDPRQGRLLGEEPPLVGNEEVPDRCLTDVGQMSGRCRPEAEAEGEGEIPPIAPQGGTGMAAAPQADAKRGRRQGRQKADAARVAARLAFARKELRAEREEKAKQVRELQASYDAAVEMRGKLAEAERAGEPEDWLDRLRGRLRQVERGAAGYKAARADVERIDAELGKLAAAEKGGGHE